MLSARARTESSSGNGDAGARPGARRVHHPDPAVSAPGQDTRSVSRARKRPRRLPAAEAAPSGSSRDRTRPRPGPVRLASAHVRAAPPVDQAPGPLLRRHGRPDDERKARIRDRGLAGASRNWVSGTGKAGRGGGIALQPLVERNLGLPSPGTDEDPLGSLAGPSTEPERSVVERHHAPPRRSRASPREGRARDSSTSALGCGNRMQLDRVQPAQGRLGAGPREG